jgi:hypothetical protein
MAVRPWVSPADVKAYSDNPEVKNREDSKLEVDISRAESYVIQYTGNKFDDETYPVIPASVKTAVILLAESYAATAAALAKEGAGTFKSETHDEYSYTLADSASKIGNLDLSYLLDEFKISAGKITMRMRRL